MAYRGSSVRGRNRRRPIAVHQPCVVHNRAPHHRFDYTVMRGFSKWRAGGIYDRRVAEQASCSPCRFGLTVVAIGALDEHMAIR